MALLQVNYLSLSLFRTVTLNVILPSDKAEADKSGYCIPKDHKFKTLYLLHGLLGYYNGWLSNTRIQRLAEEKNLAVVMPSGDNSFYVDGITPNSNYGKFIGEELVEVTRKMFPLSDKREDTFIGGLSMGGFGALRNGLKYADTFSHIIALSAAVHILEEDPQLIKNESGVFGDLEEARKSDKNPLMAMNTILVEGKEKPKIYMACGSNDHLYINNRKYRDILTENGFNVTYSEVPGAAHTWDFWDDQIKPFLNWLPLEDSFNGLGDGNVQKK